ncbi:proline-rich receptor-like protein kinase PERK9 [Triticum urartu]|uniref:proline-rich receptor-like protein kinase PERK9 n=1 Tax=Triticum urartu TaxID=4572 RepID=UPI00204448C6|nr:proline-rich receptor-like protein kinase PERK9 [Triticum urartu]
MPAANTTSILPHPPIHPTPPSVVPLHPPPSKKIHLRSRSPPPSPPIQIPSSSSRGRTARQSPSSATSRPRPVPPRRPPLRLSRGRPALRTPPLSRRRPTPARPHPPPEQEDARADQEDTLLHLGHHTRLTPGEARAMSSELFLLSPDAPAAKPPSTKAMPACSPPSAAQIPTSIRTLHWQISVIFPFHFSYYWSEDVRMRNCMIVDTATV